MCYDNGGSMYTIKDQVADAFAGIALGAAFIWLWAVAARADLAIVGF
jgi:hypothetical protein